MLPEQIIIMILLICLMNVIFSSRADDINIRHCSDRWLEMNDENFAEIVDRYKKCLELVNRMKRDDRIKYKSKMGENIAISCKSFLESTGFGPKGLVRVVRHVMRELKPYLEEDIALGYASDDESNVSSKELLGESLSTPAVNTANENISESTPNYKTLSSDIEYDLDENEIISKGTPCAAAKRIWPFYLIKSVENNAQESDDKYSEEVHMLMAYIVLILVQIIVLILLVWNCFLHYRLVQHSCLSKRPSADFRHDISKHSMISTCKCPGESCAPSTIINTDGGGDSLAVCHAITSDATPSTSAEMAARKLKHPMINPKKSSAVSSISSSDLGSDSEFEALMRRRPLLESKKRPTRGLKHNNQ